MPRVCEFIMNYDIVNLLFLFEFDTETSPNVIPSSHNSIFLSFKILIYFQY